MTSTVHEAARPGHQDAVRVARAAAVAAPGPGPLSGGVPARLRRLGVEVAKFGVVGGSGVGVNFVVFNLLLHGPGVAPMTATVLASAVAMGTNYLGFRFFAYRDRAARGTRRLALFFAFSGIGVAMETLLFYAAHHGAGMSGPLGSNVAKALSILLASAFRFLVYRTWVFQHRGRPRPA
ncbi:GtrA family protein [Streptomyces longispororuber]|uniref:GtrA family protein n=1 Tax=Streptomyces longispororuber TaxID=68230 RepID=UPI0033D26C02